MILVMLGMVSSSTPRHLVVLSHGLHGCRHDLTYLAKALESYGCLVLKSSGNEYLESHNGIEEGAKRLATEVKSLKDLHPSLTHISLVGNSLGGLYCRFAIKELFDPDSGLVAGLHPLNFMVSTSFSSDYLIVVFPAVLKNNYTGMYSDYR